MPQLQFALVPPAHWPALHRMMVLQGFPHVPEDYHSAEAALRTTHSYGVYAANKLVAAVLFVHLRPGDSALLDAVCLPGWEGKWLSRRVLCALAELAFVNYQLRCVYVQSATQVGLCFALRAGFQAVPSLSNQGSDPVLVLTPNLFNRRFHKRQTLIQHKGDVHHGIVV